MQNPFVRDGEAVDVTKIEIEILDNCRSRWILWSGPERLYSTVAKPAQIPDMLQAARIFLEGMAGIPPAVLSSKESQWPGR